ncbi:MAG: ATP-binding protein [Christensenellales bacterium]|jgi:DNA replication protein DnaC
MDREVDFKEQYRQRREHNRKLTQANREEAFRRLPELLQIEEEILAVSLQQWQSVLEDPFAGEKTIDGAYGRIEALRRKKQKLLDQHPEEAFLLQPVYDCAECQDKGMIGRRRCHCLVNAMIESGQVNMPLIDRQTFDTFDLNVFPPGSQREQMGRVFAIFREYADAFPSVEKPNIHLFGGTGLGKTFLLSSLARAVLERGYRVSSFTAYRLIQRFLDFHLGRSAGIDDILEADLLIIDDLGTEPIYRNVSREYLFTVINERICSCRPTVVATNLMADALMQQYGERVCSRLFDGQYTRVLRLEGKDLRTLRTQGGAP